MAGFEDRVLDEAESGFLGIADAEVGLRHDLHRQGGEYLAEFTELALIAAGKDDTGVLE
jgi:hypothetical protein